MTRVSFAFGISLMILALAPQAQSAPKFDAETHDLPNIPCDAPDLLASVVAAVNDSASLRSRKATILRIYDSMDDAKVEKIRRDQAIASLAEAMNATPSIRKELENGGMRTSPLISHSCSATAITNHGSFHISYYLMPNIDDGEVMINITQRMLPP